MTLFSPAGFSPAGFSPAGFSPAGFSPADPTRALRCVTVVLAVLVAWSVLPAADAAADAAQGPDPVGVWPLSPEPEVVAVFDPPDSPFGTGHRGVDLRGSPGQSVRSALPGTVSFAGPLAGRGVVVVSHGTTRTTYEPVTAGVGVGDVVAGADVIGTLQVPGSHCFPQACLHWGWIEGASTYLDPLRLVGAGPVRLLPLWRDLPVPGARASPTPISTPLLTAPRRLLAAVL